MTHVAGMKIEPAASVGQIIGHLASSWIFVMQKKNSARENSTWEADYRVLSLSGAPCSVLRMGEEGPKQSGVHGGGRTSEVREKGILEKPAMHRTSQGNTEASSWWPYVTG